MDFGVLLLFLILAFCLRVFVAMGYSGVFCYTYWTEVPKTLTIIGDWCRVAKGWGKRLAMENIIKNVRYSQT